jgi:microcystin-dependent protein
MRRDFDMGGLAVVDLSDGIDAADLVTYQQLQAVQFNAEDDVEQILDTQIIKRDGTVAMALALDMALNRIVNLSTATQPAHAQLKGNFDTQVTNVQTQVLARTGILSMTGNLSMQVGPTTPRYKITNVGFPTVPGDLVNLFFFEQQIATVGANDIPVGAFMPFFGSSAQVPANFLLCDGREVSRTLYQNLFLVIGVAYGTPSNVNVFRLPDLRGRVIVGKDNMGGSSANVLVNSQADALGGQLGEELHVLVTGEMPVHDHSYDDAQAASGGAGSLQGATATDSNNTVLSSGAVTGSSGSGVGHNNVQPSMAVNYIIRI